MVYITGYGTLDNAVQAIKIGAYDYIKKPFSTNDLRLCLKRYQERQALKEKARLAEQRYFHLVQSLPLLVFVLRKDFQLEFISQASTVILGYTPEEALGNPNWFLERIPPDDRERIRQALESAFRSGGASFSSQCRFSHKKGHPIHAILKSINPTPGAGGLGVERFEGIVIDITDRVFLEKALVQREKLKTLGTISAEVAHEIRNPLVAIGGFARRMQKKFSGVSECDIIVRETSRLEKMLDRIRDYLKPVEVCPKELLLSTVILDCVDLLSPEMQRRGVWCEVELGSNVSAALADPDILRQICINLLRNAIDAMKGGGTLNIKTYESEQNLHIAFRNPTLKPLARDPEHLFLPFDQGGESIGLPLCYRLARNMGGLLSFAQGGDCTVFTISLPKAAQHETGFSATC